MSRVWLFPGQGSQAVGMGEDLYQWRPEARQVFDLADRVLGYSLSSLCFRGPEAELRRTANTQPALLTAGVAAARILEASGQAPAAVAGHSLGEYTALVVAGSLSFADAVRAVHWRGRCMQEAVPEGVGAMAAILGLEVEVMEEVCRQAAGAEVVSPANLNAPGQVVIAGHAGAVARAIQAARERGARRAMPLNVSAPFHCALMEPAARRLRPVLDEIPFHDARVPVWVNVDAAPVTTGAALRQALVRQVASPVRWEETMRRMGEEGFCDFLEVGPGTVLAGLARRNRSDPVTVRSAGSRQALETLGPGTP